LKDRRFNWTYLFGAICPARGAGSAVVMPTVNVEAMNHHLAAISTAVSAGAIAVLVVDRAGWHRSRKLMVPDNIVLLPLPPYSPELNPVENIWQYLRANWLAISVFDSYDDIVDACCNAWNFFANDPDVVASITNRNWARVSA